MGQTTLTFKCLECQTLQTSWKEVPYGVLACTTRKKHCSSPAGMQPSFLLPYLQILFHKTVTNILIFMDFVYQSLTKKKGKTKLFK